MIHAERIAMKIKYRCGEVFVWVCQDALGLIGLTDGVVGQTMTLPPPSKTVTSSGAGPPREKGGAG